MRVLVVETDAGAADDAIARLQAAGHEVVRCHDRAEHHAFPCVELAEHGSCPLDGEGVDVALTVRARPMPVPTGFEDGAACALRAHVPLVVAGRVAWNPFDRFPGVTVATDDVVAACEAAAAAPLERHQHVATDALRTSLEKSGVATDDVNLADVAVTRTRAGLRIILDVPIELPRSVLGVAATRVTAAIRTIDSGAHAIDVIARVAAAA